MSYNYVWEVSKALQHELDGCYDVEESVDLFVDKLPGNTCDFLDAEGVGFFTAMAEYLQDTYDMVIQIACVVHRLL